MIENDLSILLNDRWRLGDNEYEHRLLHCFGSSPQEKLTPTQAAAIIRESGTQFLTIYTHGDLRRLRSLDDFPLGYAGLRLGDVRPLISIEDYTLLVNMNHACSPSEILPRAEVASQLSGSNWIKLEVLTEDLRRPRNQDVIVATETLKSRGYEVLPLIEPNARDAKNLEEMGVLAVRVVMAEIGSMGGLPHPNYYRTLRSELRIPIIAEGGLGSPVDAFHSIANGADAVLTNKAIFASKDPIGFIRTMKRSTDAGRISYLAGRLRPGFVPNPINLRKST